MNRLCFLASQFLHFFFPVRSFHYPDNILFQKETKRKKLKLNDMVLHGVEENCSKVLIVCHANFFFFSNRGFMTIFQMNREKKTDFCRPLHVSRARSN